MIVRLLKSDITPGPAAVPLLLTACEDEREAPFFGIGPVTGILEESPELAAGYFVYTQQIGTRDAHLVAFFVSHAVRLMLGRPHRKTTWPDTNKLHPDRVGPFSGPNLQRRGALFIGKMLSPGWLR